MDGIDIDECFSDSLGFRPVVKPVHDCQCVAPWQQGRLDTFQRCPDLPEALWQDDPGISIDDTALDDLGIMRDNKVITVTQRMAPPMVPSQVLFGDILDNEFFPIREPTI